MSNIKKGYISRTKRYRVNRSKNKKNKTLMDTSTYEPYVNKLLFQEKIKASRVSKAFKKLEVVLKNKEKNTKVIIPFSGSIYTHKSVISNISSENHNKVKIKNLENNLSDFIKRSMSIYTD